MENDKASVSTRISKTRLLYYSPPSKDAGTLIGLTSLGCSASIFFSDEEIETLRCILNANAEVAK